jgi:type VI secretion system protein ImpM
MPHPAAGFFGKLPSAGDFVQRRLPASFVDAWDQHFEGAVAQSRAMMGGDWHEAYHASPVWRFLLSPRVCGDTAWLGVMGPGTDRVGRCFPMVIASALSADPETCRQALVHGASWCDTAERLHAAAQRDGSISVDAFDELVASLPAPLDAAATGVMGAGDIDWSISTHWRLPLAESGNAGARLERCWQQLASAAGPWCLWWTRGSGRVPATLLITRGLPHADAYAGFLDAGQSGLSWRSEGAFEAMPAFSTAPAVVHAYAPPAGIIAAAPVSDDASAPLAAWLPDDLDLLDGLGSVEPVAVLQVAPSAHQDPGALSDNASLEQPIASVGVIDRPDCALTAVAAQVGKVESRQQAIAAVTAICRQMTPAAMAAGLQVLCSQILAVSPQLHLASEDLIDPVLEDCAVIAAQLSGGHAQLVKIGAATAWHWRGGRLQPLFSSAPVPSPETAGEVGDDFNDLLFRHEAPALPGLGAIARPECAEIQCEIVVGDRLLLVATPVLTALPPDVLVHSLAMPSCDDARRNLALAVGLGADPAQWPLAIIEIAA